MPTRYSKNGNQASHKKGHIPIISGQILTVTEQGMLADYDYKPSVCSKHDVVTSI